MNFKILIAFICCAIFPSISSGNQPESGMHGKTKHAVIDKTSQTLMAYEGDRIIFRTHISTGKWDASTPNGRFEAGEKSIMHYSRKYHNAPMPFSVHVTGNVFIHGFTEVPNYPASHGCIRVPLTNGRINPAEWFFYWIQPGTPIEIVGAWKGEKIYTNKINLSLINEQYELKQRQKP